MYKMLFDTGVRYEDHFNKAGKLIKLPYEEWHGSLHIAYFLEYPPPDGYKVKYLIPASSISCVLPGEITIPIVAGGMLSDLAVFEPLRPNGGHS